ncbi:MAG: hypothetical protein EOO53_20390 [Gammaproteobacteria bacterium]|nr:MAG: hypothetical protein EOO53_20390 [Gammaproteobacteria bacterium]
MVYQFDSIIKEFLAKIESLKETMPLVMIFMSINSSDAHRKFADFIDQHGIVEKNDEDGEENVSFSPDDSHNYKTLEKRTSIASNSLEILPKSLFVTLISEFDSFLGKLIREIFNVKPEILNASEKNLTFARLLELNSIEEAKEFIIEKEVEAVLRESHSEHFNWLESKLGITLRKDLPVWEKFIEITERRNLFVHCDGVISSQYLSTCRMNKVKFEKDYQVGEKLVVSQDYFDLTYKTLYEISVKLTQVVWRKLLPYDLEHADGSLNDICFELLKNKHYDLSDILLDFATTILRKHYNEETKNVFIVNKALSLKLGGNEEKCKEIVLAKDWSACSDKFKIAKEALLNNFDEVQRLMKKIGPDGEVNKASYKIWPLFEGFRKIPEFPVWYKEVFEEEYKAIETPKKFLDELISKADQNDKEKDEYEKEFNEQVDEVGK